MSAARLEQRGLVHAGRRAEDQRLRLIHPSRLCDCNIPRCFDGLGETRFDGVGDDTDDKGRPGVNIAAHQQGVHKPGHIVGMGVAVAFGVESTTMAITPVSAAVLLLVVAQVSSGRNVTTAASFPPQEQAGPEKGTLTGDVEHGRYIVERVAMSAECHSLRDEKGNIIPEQRFIGGSDTPQAAVAEQLGHSRAA